MPRSETTRLARRRLLLALPWIPLGVAAYVLVRGRLDTRRKARFVLYRPANGYFFISPSVAFGSDPSFDAGAIVESQLGGVGGVGMICPQHFELRVFERGQWRFAGARPVSSPFPASPGDVPFCADFNGDGSPDSGVFRDGTWIIDASAGTTGAPLTFRFGEPGDKPIVVNLSGRGNATDRRDVVYGVYRAGVWKIDADGDGTADAVHYFGGEPQDIPLLLPRWTADPAVSGYSLVIFRDGFWHIRPDPDRPDVLMLAFGMIGDIPSVYYGPTIR